jgi:hypothetical protein
MTRRLFLLLVAAVGLLGLAGWWVYSVRETLVFSAPAVYDAPRYAIVAPPIRHADRVNLPDHEQIIGVLIDGKARAYQVRAMSGGPKVHVVNDKVGAAPLTVTHCDRLNCTRVFTGPGDDPLDITRGGWNNEIKEMMLRSGEGVYLQKSGEPVRADQPFPYKDHPFEVTTWKA